MLGIGEARDGQARDGIFPGDGYGHVRREERLDGLEERVARAVARRAVGRFVPD